MIAAGIDLGGTKIETQIFDANWHRISAHRVPTPTTYSALVEAIALEIHWAKAQAGDVPTGICAPGQINPATNLALTANLPASGQPLPTDIARAAGKPITYLNDGRAQALSEAIFGQAKGYATALTLNLGTGISGGIVAHGQLLPAATGTGGEVGHFALAATPMLKHALPLLPCGCGRIGCVETLISGPGLTRIAKEKTGQTLKAQHITTHRHTDPALAAVWHIWCDLVTEWLVTLTLTVDPACIVFAGGLAQAPGLIPDLTTALHSAQLGDFPIPKLLLAEGGDATGARGAAYAAWSAGAKERPHD
jgi:N-acetylglucosamine kinase